MILVIINKYNQKMYTVECNRNRANVFLSDCYRGSEKCMTQEYFNRALFEEWEINKIKIMIIENNTNIIKIPKVRGVKVINCTNCTNLQHISLPSSVEMLNCVNCPNLKTIDGLLNLKKVLKTNIENIHKYI